MVCNNILEAMGHTPIIRLNRMVDEDSAEVLVKYEGLNVGGSIKTRTAYNMLKSAEKQGLINENSIIVEPTSGNQGIGLALIGAVKGYKTIIIMPDSVSEERRKLVKHYGAEVVLVSGPVSVSANSPAVKVLKVESANEMLEQCLLNFSTCDIAIMCAAVADYHVKNSCDHKIKRENDEIPQIVLEKNPDIAATLGKIKKQDQITVGFALETNNELSNAKSKLLRKNLDMIVLNSLNDKNSGFGTDNNTVTIIQSNGEMLHYDNKPKIEVAKDIVDTIIDNYL